MLHKKIFVSSVGLVVSLSSCNYGYTTKKVVYNNEFFPWPSGMSYSSIINSQKSVFKCTYDCEYNYHLEFYDGDIVEYEGKYLFENESFILLNDEQEEVIKLVKINYYQFTEEIVYEDVVYTVVWHAKDIFG